MKNKIKYYVVTYKNKNRKENSKEFVIHPKKQNSAFLQFFFFNQIHTK